MHDFVWIVRVLHNGQVTREYVRAEDAGCILWADSLSGLVKSAHIETDANMRLYGG